MGGEGEEEEPLPAEEGEVGGWLKSEFCEECFEVCQVFGDDGVEDRLLNVLVAVNRDVAESNHVFHGGGAGWADDGVLSEQLEGIAAGLRNSKASLGHAMHR